MLYDEKYKLFKIILFCIHIISKYFEIEFNIFKSIKEANLINNVQKSKINKKTMIKIPTANKEETQSQ